jgi:hypothetical protein
MQTMSVVNRHEYDQTCYVTIGESRLEKLSLEL